MRRIRFFLELEEVKQYRGSPTDEQIQRDMEAWLKCAKPVGSWEEVEEIEIDLTKGLNM